MIQILGLRDRIDSRTGKARKTTVFFNQGYRLPSVDDVFGPALSDELKKIPSAEHYNLYFTVAQCFEDKERELQEQWVIPFDIDEIKFENEEAVVPMARRVAGEAAHVLGVPLEDLGVIFSGHGVQLFLKLTYAIRSKDYFDETREHYGAICDKITKHLAKAGLTGKADPTVWSHARLMRLPDTENRKPNKPVRRAMVLHNRLVPHGYYLAEQSGLAVFQKAETVPEATLKQYPKPDSKAVMEGCLFLGKCKAEPKWVNEPQWYAEISVTARLENGRELTHLLSEGHPGYNYDETEMKIDQALKAAGPRTCKDISTRWDGCPKCPHWGKITSPIMIRGADYLASKDFGFRKMTIPKDGGAPYPGRPVYEDLLKFFSQKWAYVCIENAESVYTFNGKHWQEMSHNRIKEWMRSIVKPDPATSEMSEFIGQLVNTHVHSANWFSQQRAFKMNFQNCVLDLRTMEVERHKPEQGFMNVLPFDYDPLAVSSRWKEFLSDSMQGDDELVRLLEEFGGYALSGDPYWSWGHKALILHGEGENGKSVFLDVLSALAGEDGYSAVPVQDFENITSRYALLGKLFNKSEETAKTAFRDSQIFKAITSGGEITARQLFRDEVKFKSSAKILMSTNALPYNSDNTHGMGRRLIIVPFREKFVPGHPKRDPDVTRTLMGQLPGICNSLIAAYRQAKERGRFVYSAVAHAEVERYKTESDSVKMFLDETCDVQTCNEPIGTVKDELYRSYADFCKEGGMMSLNKVHFWRQMRVHVPDLDKREHRHRDGGRKRSLAGIALLGQDR